MAFFFEDFGIERYSIAIGIHDQEFTDGGCGLLGEASEDLIKPQRSPGELLVN